MPASFTVTAQPERDLIRITLSGFFDMPALADFDRARHAAYARLRCGPNRHVTLADLRDLKLQAPDVFDAFRALVTDPATRSRRLALVAGGSVIRLQVRRLIDRDDMRYFDDVPAAERWLAQARANYALAG